MKITHIKKMAGWVAGLALLVSANAGEVVNLDQGFAQPPPSAHPWVFWMWLRVDTTPAAITKDLEEMHAKGIEGAILYDSGVGGHLEVSAKMVLDGKGYRAVKTADYAGSRIDPIDRPALESWTPHSRELVRFAAKEAGRLGIKLVVTVGLAGTSGPIAPEYGQQKLVDIAMAFMSEPDLVLLDEPCAGVNPSLVGGISSLLKQLNKTPRPDGRASSFVVIEHNMDFVMDLCHRIMVMVEGKVMAIGTPAEIRANKQVLDAYLGS